MSDIQTPVSGETLLQKICHLRFGSSGAGEYQKLRDELQTHRSNTVDISVSRQAIEAWFTQDRKIERPRSLYFLYKYIISKVKSSDVSSKDKLLYEQTLLFLRQRAVAAENTNKHIGAFSSSMYNVGDRKFEIYSTLIDISKKIPRNELNDLFYTTPASKQSDERDQSYYILYRYSTMGGILKTLLVCKRPIKNVITHYSFVQFVRGGTNFQPDIIRESTGFIIKMEQCYYWLGYNYRISGEKKYVNYDEYQIQRLESKYYPVGLELITAEYGDINLDRSLFSGLITTVAAKNQPILARVAFLHVGTTHSIGSIITDDMIIPTEMAGADLTQDLRELMMRVQASGYHRFGRALANAIAEEKISETGASMLANRITRMISNTPEWDRINNNPTLSGEGAIESFSINSDRPRP